MKPSLSTGALSSCSVCIKIVLLNLVKSGWWLMLFKEFIKLNYLPLYKRFKENNGVRSSDWPWWQISARPCSPTGGWPPPPARPAPRPPARPWRGSTRRPGSEIRNSVDWTVFSSSKCLTNYVTVNVKMLVIRRVEKESCEGWFPVLRSITRVVVVVDAWIMTSGTQTLL